MGVAEAEVEPSPREADHSGPTSCTERRHTGPSQGLEDIHSYVFCLIIILYIQLFYYLFPFFGEGGVGGRGYTTAKWWGTLRQNANPPKLATN